MMLNCRRKRDGSVPSKSSHRDKYCTYIHRVIPLKTASIRVHCACMCTYIDGGIGNS